MYNENINTKPINLLYKQGIFLTILEGKVLVASEIHPSPRGCTQQVLQFKIHLKLY